VSEAAVEATLPHVSPQVGAMIRLQPLTGMRPGEVVLIRACDIDRSETAWTYRPERHKMQHLGHERPIFLGPKAQEVLRPFLKLDPTAHLFSPREAEEARYARRRSEARAPLDRLRGKPVQHSLNVNFKTNDLEALKEKCAQILEQRRPDIEARIAHAKEVRRAFEAERGAQWPLASPPGDGSPTSSDRSSA
jgi:integrase